MCSSIDTQKNSEASLDAYLASAPAPKVAEKDILKKADGTVVAAGPAKRKERIRTRQAREGEQARA